MHSLMMVKRGKVAPRMYLSRTLAAIAEAAVRDEYVSIKYRLELILCLLAWNMSQPDLDLRRCTKFPMQMEPFPE